MMIRRLAPFFILSLGLASIGGQANETITRGNNLSVDVAGDGRIVMDLEQQVI